MYNHEEGISEVDEIGGIKIVEEIKYLGVKIVNKKDMYQEQRRAMMKKAQKMGNLTHGIICRSCNKLMIGKTYWKNLALPGILYGINVITLTEKEVNQLQVIENGVYRRILGAPWEILTFHR